MTKDEIFKLLKVYPKDGGMYKMSEKSFRNNFQDVYEDIISYTYPEGFSFKQKMYHYLLDDFEFKIGLCECGKRCKFIDIFNGYLEYCSVSCSRKSKKVQEKVKQTCLKKYGVEHSFKSDIVKEKTIKTCLKKYGVSHASKSKEVQDKMKQTCLEKYGVYHPMKFNKVKEKTKQTCLERYNCKCALNNDIVVKKAKQTNLNKYGVEIPQQSEEIKNKAKQTCLKRYGVENPYQSKEIKEKIKKINLEKYGVEHPLQSKELLEKAKQTNLKKYGVEYPMESNDIKAKSRNSYFNKYGVEYITQSEEIKEKIKQTNLEKYGVEWFCLHSEAKHYSSNSKPNLEFASILDNNNIEYKREYVISHYSYDFKINDILIEINPTITHNSHMNIFGGEPHKNDYHLSKTLMAKEHGFRCVHVWDWDDKNKIVEMLKPKTTLYARNLKLKEVNVSCVDEFLKKHHIQGTCKGQIVCIGLFNNDELVQIMTFGKPRYNKNYEWELLRLCTKGEYFIVGGSEKLFRNFLKIQNPNSIISYCDLSKFDGNVYEKLGFLKIGTPKPSKHWYGKKKHITDNLLRQRGFDQLFGTNYGKGSNNEELMLQHGFLPVYDCGQATYIWLQK